MRPIVTMIFFVLILGSILTSALVGIDKITEPRIKENEQRKVYRGVLDAFGIAFEKGTETDVFASNVEPREIGGKPFYTAADGTVAFEFLGSGLWGPIYGVVALQPDRKTIKGLTVINQEETPGLGGRIGEEGYLATFKGKEITPEIKIVGAGKAEAANEVDGITGATLSCKAFETILNAEASKCIPILEGSAE